jgi:ATP-dependent DNA helicase RecG
VRERAALMALNRASRAEAQASSGNLRDYSFGGTFGTLRNDIAPAAIAHREYTSAAPATMTIFRDRVIFRNPHVPHLRGRIDPAHFTPFSKNPTICRFMLQLGRYEQVGSGVYNVTKYLPLCSHGALPLFEEQPDLFVTTIPLAPTAKTPLVTGEVTGEVRRLVLAMEGEMKRTEMQGALGLKHEDHFREAYLIPALRAGLIEMTIPDKPNSRLQKYRLTAAGRQYLAALPKTQA